MNDRLGVIEPSNEDYPEYDRECEFDIECELRDVCTEICKECSLKLLD